MNSSLTLRPNHFIDTHSQAGVLQLERRPEIGVSRQRGLLLACASPACAGGSPSQVADDADQAARGVCRSGIQDEYVYCGNPAWESRGS